MCWRVKCFLDRWVDSLWLVMGQRQVKWKGSLGQGGGYVTVTVFGAPTPTFLPMNLPLECPPCPPGAQPPHHRNKLSL